MGKGRQLQDSGGENLDGNLLTELLRSPRHLLYRYDLVNDRFTYISHSIEQVIGISSHTIQSESNSFLLPYLHSDDRSRLSRLLQDLKAASIDADSMTIDYRLRHVEGHDTWVSDHISILRSDNDCVLIGNARHVPWIKLNSLFDESKELLWEHLPFPYFRMRVSDGKLLACNDVLWKSLNYKNRQECLENCRLADYYPAKTRHLLIIRLVRDGQLNRVEVEGSLNGKPFWVEISTKYFPEQGYVEGVARDITPLKVLSPAEKAVLELVLNGLCNKQIAQTLNRSIRTIEDHRSHIMQKLNAQNLIDLVRKTYLVYTPSM